jgi:hypothetical protein
MVAKIILGTIGVILIWTGYFDVKLLVIFLGMIIVL